MNVGGSESFQFLLGFQSRATPPGAACVSSSLSIPSRIPGNIEFVEPLRPWKSFQFLLGFQRSAILLPLLRRGLGAFQFLLGFQLLGFQFG
jgi:hypothetical protein